MNIKKAFKSKPLVFFILLAGTILIVILSTIFLIKTDRGGDITSATIQYPANKSGDNSSFIIWTKMVKTSNDIAFLKSDSYNVMSISLYPHGYWNPIMKRWAIPIQIAGFGATKSGYGILRANGLKTITLDTNQGLDAYTYSSANLHGNLEYYSSMLTAATDSMDDETWPSFTPDLIDSSGDHITIIYNSGSQVDNDKKRYNATMNKWQYSDLFGSDASNAIYALDTKTECYPGRVEDIYYISKFSWGLIDNSNNVIHLKVHLPPDPTSMTPQDMKRYGINRYTYTNNGQIKYGYSIENIQYEVS